MRQQQPRDLESMTVEEKRELLAELLAEPGQGPGTVSREQHRLWMLHQLEESTPWQVFVALRITGELDLATLQLALTEVVQRHEVLRMGFVEVNGQPLGTVTPAVSLRMPVVEAGGDGIHEELGRLAKREAQLRFDIEQGPLVRSTVVRRAPDDHVLLLTIHQLVADERTLRLVVDELLTVYNGLRAGAPAELPPVRAAFADLITAQREWLDSHAAAEDGRFWRERLASLSPLELPTDRPRPAKKTIAAATTVATVPASPAADLIAFAERTGHEVADVLLAGITAVLSRYAVQRELAVGIPAPALWYENADELAGPLENMLPLRLAVLGNESLQQHVAQVCAGRAEAMAHGRLPFDRIVEEVRPPRDLSRTPLFQVSFRYEEAPAVRKLAGADVTEIELDPGWTPHDIDLTAQRRADALRLRARFNTDLFDAATIDRMLRHVIVLLTEAVAEPLRDLAEIPLLTGEERKLVVTSWNATDRPYPRERCLHHLIEDQVQAVPDAVALMCGDTRLTYRQFNERANAIAYELITRGVRPETRVGVVVNHSVDAVVGLLGVLKAGGAYVPLDAAYPADRLRLIRTDAGIETIVGTRTALAELAGGPGEADTVEIPQTDPAPSSNPDVDLRPANLAYQIYTSGSTGAPKGVSVEHRQVVHSTSARVICEASGRPDRYLLLAPLTFDASGGGLYWTLTRGGTVVMPTDAETHDLRRLGKLIRSLEITHVDGVPSHYGVLLESDLGPHDSVRCCVLAGEALPPSLVAEHYERSPEAALYNEYGATEATIWASVHPCRPEDAELVRVPIGGPIPNARLYVLDDRLNPVPSGVAGELYIGGGGVARGYGGRPGMTATRFLPDPFDSRPGARLYRTGDRARHLPDGKVEFLGRVDTQVKIRGFRVELAEIENVLLRHPLVTEAVVTVRNGQLLVAYLVPVNGRALTMEALAAHLLRQLPDYMVPAHFVSLERLPLTKHGKIDFAALPAPDEVSGPGGHVDPANELEAGIAETFANVLGVSRVSAAASFFELGGDSLLVARLVARLCQEHDVDLPIDEIFKVPTVQGVAHAVEAHQRRRDVQDSDVRYAEQVAELLAEVKLDPAVRPGDLPRGDFAHPRHVLVTGATGYLGAFIAAEAIRRTDAVVHCLIRAESEEAAAERIEEVMRDYRTWDDSYRERLRPVVGDLAKPLLGLSEERFDELAETLDLIYHSGAIVNFTYPYEAMKPANVHGTEELLRLASTRKVKGFNHISSVDVFMGTGAPRPFTEDDLPDTPLHIPTGYPRTKWIAEKLVMLARDRGMPVIVHRPWMVTGHRETGAAHNTDYLYVYLKGFLELGVLPLFDEVVNTVPVDFTAEAVLYTSLREEDYGRTFNITNPRPATVSQCYGWLRTFGYELNVVDVEEARRRALGVDQDHTLYPLTPILRGGSMRHEVLDPELQKRIDPTDECRQLLSALEGSGITCPPMDEAWAHQCFRYLVGTGFLPEPEAGRTPVDAGRTPL